MSGKIAVIILARKNSKRFPGKMLYVLRDLHLYEYTILSTLTLGYPVYFYTDCEIMTEEVLRKYPSVNVRGKKYESNDDNHIHKTNLEIQEYNKEIGADIIINMQCTSPLRKNELLPEWVKQFINGNYDCGFAACKLLPGLYYSGGKEINIDVAQRNYNMNYKTDVYKETGSFYIFKAEQIYKNHFMNTDKRIMFEDPYDIDINTIDDIRRFERGFAECIQK